MLLVWSRGGAKIRSVIDQTHGSQISFLSHNAILLKGRFGSEAVFHTCLGPLHKTDTSLPYKNPW